MKRWQRFVICVLTVLCIYTFPIVASGAERGWDDPGPSLSGGGTEGDPYLISTPEELYSILAQREDGYSGCYFQLTEDLYLNQPEDFIRGEDGTINGVAPEADAWAWDYGHGIFGGVLDGDGHTIYGLYINGASAMLGELSAGGAFRDLHFRDVYTAAGNADAAVVRDNYGTIEGCSFEGTVLSTNSGASLAHYNYGTIHNCTSAGRVDSQTVGGICGHNHGTVENCRNDAVIVGESYAGGIAYWNYADGVVTGCVNTGVVSTTGGYVAGISGLNDGTISGCGNTGDISSVDYGNPAGICGTAAEEDAYVVGCWNSGTVSLGGTELGDAGGICSYVRSGATLAYCYNYGPVEYGGGIVGMESSANIASCLYDSAFVASSNSYGTASTTEEIQSQDYIDDYNDYVDTSPLEGLAYWVSDESDTNGGYPVLAPEDVLCRVEIQVSGRGAVTPCRPFGILPGRSRTLTFTPEYGYEVVSVMVDGQEREPGQFLTLTAQAPGALLVEVAFGSDGTVADSFHGGSGTEEDPYQITTMAEFAYLARQVNDGWSTSDTYFRVMNDITFNDPACFALDGAGRPIGVAEGARPREWIPIGLPYDQSFDGVLDGGGHTISGLYITGDREYAGLFGYIGSGAVVRNLTIRDGYLECPDGWMGAFVGKLDGRVENCHNDNVTVDGDASAAGIASSGGTIVGCTNSAMVMGAGNVGGIAGSGGTIDRCINTGDITATGSGAGGIAGDADAVLNCVSSGTITSPSWQATGGIVGRVSSSGNSAILNCISFATINGTGGGIYGGISGDLSLGNCLFQGEIVSSYANNSFGIGPYQGNYTFTAKNCYYTVEGLTTNEIGAYRPEEELKAPEILNDMNLFTHRCTDYQISYWEAGEDGLPVFSQMERFYLLTGLRPIGGSLNTQGTLCLPEGSDVTITAAPERNNTVYAILIDGVAVGTEGEEVYILTDLSADHTVEALFQDADGNLLTEFSAGSGTEEDPYQIATVEELTTLSQQVASGKSYEGKYFLLSVDLTLNPVEGFSWGENTVTAVNNSTDLTSWEPIGAEDAPFLGRFDGGGHTVSGLFIDGEAEYAGLFGYVGEGASVENLTLGCGRIQTTGNYAGAVAAYNAGTVRNCVNLAVSLDAATGAGGIVGVNVGTVTKCENRAWQAGQSVNYGGIAALNQGTISRCINEAALDGSDVGGICAEQASGGIELCVNRGSITGSMTGGILGDRGPGDRIGSYIRDCRNDGSIDGTYAGGIAGEAYYVQIVRCANYGTVYSEYGASGGIVGLLFASNEEEDYCGDCVNHGDVTAWYKAGGIAGSTSSAVCRDSTNYGTVISTMVAGSTGGIVGSQSSGVVYNCGNMGTVIGLENVGGVVGSTSSDVFNCYSTGTVTGTENVGGVVGHQSGYSSNGLYNCYSAGAVACEDSSAGGLIGFQERFCNMTDCWYNSETCEKPAVGAEGEECKNTNIGGLTSAEMASDEFVARLNQASREDVVLSGWVADPELGSPTLGSFQATTPDGPAYVSTSPAITEKGTVLTIRGDSEIPGALCWVAVYDKAGKMTELFRVEADGQAHELLIPAGQSWSAITLEGEEPIVEKLSGRA